MADNIKIWLEREPCPRCLSVGVLPEEDPCIQCGGIGYISLTSMNGDKIQEIKTKQNQMQADINQISARVDQIWDKVK